MNYKWVISSCAKDGKTTPLVDALLSSGIFKDIRIDYSYKASKKTKDSKTEELVIVSA